MRTARALRSIFNEEDTVSIGTRGLLDSTEDDNPDYRPNEESIADASNGDLQDPYTEPDTTFENECYYAIYITNKAMHSIFEAVGLREADYYRRTGRELVLTEALSFSQIIQKIKDFFSNLIARIKNAVEKFIVNVQTTFINGEGYAKKHKEEILKGWNYTEKNDEIQGYKGKYLAGLRSGVVSGGSGESIADCMNSIKDFIIRFGEKAKSTFTKDADKESKLDSLGSGNDYVIKDTEAYFKKIRRAMLGKTSIDNATALDDGADFKEAAMKAIYGSDQLESLKPSQLVASKLPRAGDACDDGPGTATSLVQSLIATRETINMVKRTFNDLSDDFKEACDKTINVLKDLEKNKEGQFKDGANSYITDAIKYIKELNNDVTVIYMLAVKGTIQYYRQCIAVAKKCVENQEKKESYDYYGSSRRGSGFLSDVIW